MICFRNGLLAFLLVPAGRSMAEGMRWESVGYRFGFSATSVNDAFWQNEASVSWDLPWCLEFASKCHLQTGLDVSAGLLSRSGDYGFVGTGGPTFVIGREHCPLSLDLGISPTLLSHQEFGDKNFGTIFQLTSHAGVSWDFGAHFTAGYRFQHMSNAGLSSNNSGLNLHVLSIRYRF
jgi:hypothetical protein